MSFFDEEINKTINDIKKYKEPGDLCFAMLSDSHLSEEGCITCENISRVDSEVKFRFIVHLGNVTNGNNPEKITGCLMDREIVMYKSAISTEQLLLCLGDTDGWRNERFEGQLVQFIMTDEMWYKHTSFIDELQGVSRPKRKPYYYIDLHGVRLVVLCSYNYNIDKQHGLYEKYTGIDIEQAIWLSEEALRGCSGKTVILFSHHISKSRFETGADPYIYEGRSTEAILSIIQRARSNGADTACWFGGGYGCDAEINLGGVNFAVIASQAAMTESTAKCGGVRTYNDRSLNTVNQDCWDAVVLKREKREIGLFRFGAGIDRKIKY